MDYINSYASGDSRKTNKVAHVLASFGFDSNVYYDWPDHTPELIQDASA